MKIEGDRSLKIEGDYPLITITHGSKFGFVLIYVIIGGVCLFIASLGVLAFLMFDDWRRIASLLIIILFGIMGGNYILHSIRSLFARRQLIIDFAAGEMIRYTGLEMIGKSYSKERFPLSSIDAIVLNERRHRSISELLAGLAIRTYYTCEIKNSIVYYGPPEAAKTLTIFLAKKLQKDILDAQADLRIPYDKIDESEWTKFFFDRNGKRILLRTQV